MKKLFILSVITLSCAISAKAIPSVAGDNFEIQWLFPDTSTTYGSDTVTVSGTWSSPAGYAGVVSITDGQISIGFSSDLDWSAGSFNGFVFTDTSETPNFTSLTLASVAGTPLAITPALSYTADSLSVNFTPTGVENGNGFTPYTYTFDFTEGTSPVPEASSTFILLGFAMTGLACLRRRLA